MVESVLSGSADQREYPTLSEASEPASRADGGNIITDLQPGGQVDAVFFLREASPRQTRAGEPYLALKLSDRSGQIDARVWESAAEVASQIKPDTYVRVSGKVESYRGRPQIRALTVAHVPVDAVNQHDFLPSSYRDMDELAGYLDYFMTEIYDPDFSQLLNSFFSDQEFMQRFRQAPGDVRSHHAYLGGLLEHTVSVATLCQHVTVQHPRLDADLLLTAALLHDIGKVSEYTYQGCIGYSKEGRLLGHVLIGQRMIEDKVREIEGFPRDKELMLLHALISHHGELEWGAPKKPQSAEALVLHHIDNLDARVKGFLEIVAGRGEMSWPEMQNFFRRPLDEPKAADR
ncbi:MAG: 3'-5' exoribonuclease YhaM family protein [Thermoleophilia bacterium]